MQKPRKILVISGPGIGDVITSIPTINSLKYSFPDAKIDVLNETVHGIGYKILQNNKNINELIRLERSPSEKGLRKIKAIPAFLFGKTSILSKISFIASMAKKDHDLVFNCFPSTKKSAIFSFLIGRKLRAGIKENPLAFFFNVKINSDKMHKIDIESRLIEKIGGKIRSKKIELPLDLKKAEKRVKMVLKNNGIKGNIILIHAASRNYRSWIIERWVHLADFLAARKFNVVLIGAGNDSIEAEKIHRTARKTFNLCNKFNLDETAVLIKSARLVISVNSGIMNLASALGARLIALSGPSPYGWNAFGVNSVNIRGNYDLCNGPCGKETCRIDHIECMDSISERIVLAEVKKQLNIS